MSLLQQMNDVYCIMDHRLRRSKPPLSGSRSSLTNAYEPEDVESEEASGEDGADWPPDLSSYLNTNPSIRVHSQNEVFFLCNFDVLCFFENSIRLLRIRPLSFRCCHLVLCGVYCYVGMYVSEHLYSPFLVAHRGIETRIVLKICNLAPS